MTLRPTQEQADAVEVFGEGLDMAIEALAGTGKSTTLRMIGESTTRRGTYMAFNRAVVDDAKKSFPRNVKATTAHGVAFRYVGANYAHRLQQPRLRSHDLAKRLGISAPMILPIGGGEKKVLNPGYLASSVVRALKAFSFSADPEPTLAHIEWIDGIDLDHDIVDGRVVRRRSNNDYVARTLLPYLQRGWEDWQDVEGRLPFTHDAYVKIFERGEPRLAGDFLLIDEAQDLSPVMISIAEQQTDKQVVVIGDRYQQLYEWRGSVDAMSLMTVDMRTRLSQSFRFGPEIAAAANAVLTMIPDHDADVRLLGTPTIDSTLAAVDDPKAILCRTNAKAIENVLLLQRAGRKPHLVGGGIEVAMFARAARDLKESGHTEYHDLACFDSWLAVIEYVEQDPQGSELALMVKLVEEFGVDAILDAIEDMIPEEAADVIVSTAHKSKGREWDTVQLADDFAVDAEDYPDGPELRLLYVAITRAKHVIDLTRTDAMLGRIIGRTHILG